MKTLTLDLSEFGETGISELTIEISISTNNQVLTEQKIELTNVGDKPVSELEIIGDAAKADFIARHGSGTSGESDQ